MTIPMDLGAHLPDPPPATGPLPGPWKLRLPWSCPPLSMNHRRNVFAHSRAVREVRDTTAWLARQAQIGQHDRIRVQLHYIPRDRRRRDADNLIATAKPAVDGLCDAGIVVDDDDEHVVRLMPKIHAPSKAGSGLLLVVEALPPMSMKERLRG